MHEPLVLQFQMIFMNFFFDFSFYSATPGGVLSQVGAAKAGGVEHTPQ